MGKNLKGVPTDAQVRKFVKQFTNVRLKRIAARKEAFALIRKIAEIYPIGHTLKVKLDYGYLSDAADLHLEYMLEEYLKFLAIPDLEKALLNPPALVWNESDRALGAVQEVPK